MVGRRALLRAIVLRACALLLGTLAALLLCELCLRVIGYEGAGERERWRFDPEYGTVRKDSWIFGFHIDPKRYQAVDLRGQLIPLRKPAGETRVLFIGDSATEGAFVRLDQWSPMRFDALLHAREPASPVRAINAGVWGMTTIDELHLLQDKLLPLAPDAVVLGLFMANDINFNLGHGRRRLQYRAPSLIEAARQHSALVHFLFLRALALNARYHFVSEHGFGARWVPERVRLVDRYGLHMLSYPAGELALYMTPPSPLADQAFAVLRDVLRQLQDLGARRHFALRVLLIPTPSAVAGRLNILHYPNILVQLREAGVHIRSDQLDVGLPTRRVLAICKQLALDCVDATPELKQLGARAFFAHDEHPTVAGHEALARALLPR